VTERADVTEVLGSYVGAQTPGGCGECNAYQTMRQDGHGIWHLTVHHDDWCSVLKSKDGRG
jgi:hypothetical protein